MEMENNVDPVKVKKRVWYSLALLAGSFTMGEISHFLIGITSRAISQELQYGDQSCLQDTDISIPENFTSCDSIPNENQCSNVSYGDHNYCDWNYNGLGIQYQILAGPSFIAAFAIGGIIMGVLADMYSRKTLIAMGTLIFSICTIVTGFAQAFWQLVLLRIGLALGESACQPVSAGMIADSFPQSSRGVAMGIVNLGIYLGYGLSFAIGNYVTAANILGEGWRWSYFISGIPGVIIAVLILLTTKEPVRQKTVDTTAKESPAQNTEDETKISVREILFHICKPVMLTVCLAACIRQTSGFTWAYNAALYFQTYYPEAEIGTWLTVLPIAGGSFGLIAGGWLSDKVSKIGLQARAWVLAGSQLIGSVCALGVLFLAPPYAFICLLVTYLFSETWFSVLFAILVELAPARGMTTILAVFLFVVNNVGGNLPIIVDPLTKSMGFRGALILMYPAIMAFSALVFGISGFMLKREATAKEKKTESQEQDLDSKTS